MSELVGDARQLPPAAQEALRMRAVAALDAGRDRAEVAGVLGVTVRAVDAWWARYRAGGIDALRARTRGPRPGEHQLLDEAEQRAVRQAVLDHTPGELGLDGQLWTRAQVGALIAKLYRVELTDRGVGNYLRRWGLSFQRPDKRAVEQNPEAVRRWREETWPALRERARDEGAEVLFADQVGVRSDHITGRTWGEVGRTPVVRRSGNRFGVNAMSAISTKGRLWFMVFTGNFDAKVMLRFLRRLVRQFDRKVHLVVDRHSAHRAREVKDWLAAHADRVELHFLPGYAPELNPDELVNADLKRSLPAGRRARDQRELARETRRFFHRRQKQPHIIRGYFSAPNVRYTLE